jgi:hypothetical protein
MARNFGITGKPPFNPEVAPGPSGWPYIDEEADRHEGANGTFFWVVALVFFVAIAVIVAAIAVALFGWVRI